MPPISETLWAACDIYLELFQLLSMTNIPFVDAMPAVAKYISPQRLCWHSDELKELPHSTQKMKIPKCE